MSNWINDNYYLENPSHVTGEAYETSGRFGRVVKFRGTLSEAMDKITAPDYEVAEMLSPFVSWEQEEVTSTGRIRTMQAQRIRKAIEADERPAVDHSNLVTFEEVDALYNTHITDDEKRAFVWYMRKLGRPMEGGWRKYDEPAIPKRWVTSGVMCLDGDDFVPSFLYLSGNVYQKKAALERNEENFVAQYGQAAYEAQFALLDAKVKELYAKRLTLDAPIVADRLRILPVSDFALEFKIGGLKGEEKFKEVLSKRKDSLNQPDYAKTGYVSDYKKDEIKEISLTGAFTLWMKNNSRRITFRKGTSWLEIYELYLNDKQRGKDDDKDQFKKSKSAAREEGIRLFGEFLANELDLNDKVRIETQWNMQYNADVPVDYHRVPIGFRMARTYNGVELDIRPEKRESIAFAMMTGSGCLAYGVGLGKTWCLSFILAQFLENGWCKRPLLVTPNQVYKQFMKELTGIVPWVTVNDFYNFSPEYLNKIPSVETGNYKVDDLANDRYSIWSESQYQHLLQFVEETDENTGIVTGNDGNGEFFRFKIEKEIGVKEVAENSVTCLTYEGFRRLGIKEHGETELFSTLYEILEQRSSKDDDRQSQKSVEAFNNKVKGIIGKSQTGATVYIQDLGIDFMAIDEAHSAKKIFTVVAGSKQETVSGKEKTTKPYKITAGEPSYMGLKAFMFATYIQRRNETGNIMLLTATPFTNSPLEVYSMLALTGYKHLEKIGLNNLTDFFDQFIDVRNELVINSALKPEYKEIFVGFTNLPGLQGLIRRFFLYKFTTKETKRPNKWVLPIRQKTVDGVITELGENERVDTIIPLTTVQRVFMDEIISYAEGKRELVAKQGDKFVCLNSRIADGMDKDDDDPTELDSEGGEDLGEVSESSLNADEKAGVRLLRAANYARNLALSPYLYACNDLGEPDYLDYVESSAKLHYTMQCIATVKDWHERKNEPVSGQVIYMNSGVKYFPLLKEYLVKVVGYKEHEVGIIQGSMPKGMDKSMVQDLFLGRRFNPVVREYEPIPDQFRVKVLIGSASIREGINLQTHSTVLYNCWLDWNPTDVVQLEGRIHRQGNRFKNVRIVNPLSEDSMDIFMFQKIEEKTRRINAIWEYDGNTKTLNLEEFDPKELKYALIKDPKRVAELEVKEHEEAIENDISIIGTQLATLDDFNSLQAGVLSKYTLDKYIKIATFFRNVTDEELRTDPNKLQRTLLDIWKKQTLKDGKPAMSLKDETTRPTSSYGGYGGRHSYSSYWTNPYEDLIYAGEISQPYGFKEWNDSLRKYNRIVSDVLRPRNIEANEQGVKYAVDKLKDEKTKLEEEKKKLASEEAITNRAAEIVAERERTGYRPASVAQRVVEFSRLNYLLADKAVLVTTVGSENLQPIFKQAQSVKYDGKSAKVMEVFADRGGEAMYRLQMSGGTEIVFESEIDGGKRKLAVGSPQLADNSRIFKLQALQQKISGLLDLLEERPDTQRKKAA